MKWHGMEKKKKKTENWRKKKQQEKPKFAENMFLTKVEKWKKNIMWARKKLKKQNLSSKTSTSQTWKQLNVLYTQVAVCHSKAGSNHRVCTQNMQIHYQKSQNFVVTTTKEKSPEFGLFTLGAHPLHFFTHCTFCSLYPVDIDLLCK